MDQVQVGSEQGLPIHHTSNSMLSLPSKSLALNNILHVPSITKRLLSVQRFSRDNDVFFEFHPSHFIVKDPASKKPLLSRQSNDCLYSLKPLVCTHSSLKLQPSQPRVISKSPSAFVSSRTSSTCWHLHLSHPHKRVLPQNIPKHSLPCSRFNFNHICSAFQLGKSQKLHLPPSINKSSFVLHLYLSMVGVLNLTYLLRFINILSCL